MSYRNLMSDLAALYGGQHLPALGYTYRDYRQASAPSAAAESDRQWWSERIPGAARSSAPAVGSARRTGRPAPHHTTLALAGPGHPRRTVRRGPPPRCHAGDGSGRVVLRRAGGLVGRAAVPAQRADVRPRAAAPATWTGWSVTSPRLCCSTSISAPAATATARSRALQDTFRAAAAHADYPGLSVLRDLSRHRGTQVLAPVVFTSALGLGELFAEAVTETFGKPVWINSQGPQVLLDAQVTEFDGGILVNWDVREDAFRPGVVDAMFDRHIDELRRLASDDIAWETPRAPLITAAQRAVRDAANSKTAAPSGNSLHDGFFASAAARPDALAVIGSSGELTYGQLREQVLAVAAALRVAGVEPGDTIAVMGPKCPDQIVALLGILAAGGVYLPIGVDQPAGSGRTHHRDRWRPHGAGLRWGSPDIARRADRHRSAAGGSARRRIRARAKRSQRPRLRAVHIGVDGRAQGRRGHPRRRDEHHRIPQRLLRDWARRPMPRAIAPGMRPVGAATCSAR